MAQQDDNGFRLKHIFELVTNLPRAAVIGAMHFCNKPTEKTRIALAAATLGVGAACGLGAAFAVAAGGLACGGMAVQTFAQPAFGVPRRTRDDLMGTQEALDILNKNRIQEGRPALRFPKIDI